MALSSFLHVARLITVRSDANSTIATKKVHMKGLLVFNNVVALQVGEIVCLWLNGYYGFQMTQFIQVEWMPK